MTGWLRVFAAGLRLEAALLRREPADLMAMINVPLFTIAFMAVLTHAGRPELASYALVAPVVMALWSMALLVCGEMVDRDRWAGTLELLAAAPAPIGAAVLGRICCVTAVSVLSVAETWAVAALLFDVPLSIRHPGWFAAAVVVTAAATAGAALTMTAVFVTTRTARSFQNSLSYPFFVLGGAFVPVALLPEWLQPLCRLFFLSWATDLLRDSISGAGVTNGAQRLLVVAGLGALWFVAGFLLLRAALRRLRATGTVSYA